MSTEIGIKPYKTYVQLDDAEDSIIRYIYDYDDDSSALKTIIVENCTITNRTLSKIYEYFPNDRNLHTSSKFYNRDGSCQIVQKYFPRDNPITKKTFYLDKDDHYETVIYQYRSNPSKKSEEIISYDDKGTKIEVQTIYKNAHDLLESKIEYFDENEKIIREICEYEDDEISVREYFYDQSGEMVRSRIRISENDDKRKPKLNKKKKSDYKEKISKSGYDGDDEEEILSDYSDDSSTTSSSSLDYGLCTKSFDPLAQGVSMQSGHMPETKLIGGDLPIETF